MMDHDHAVDMIAGIGLIIVWIILFSFIQSQVRAIYSQGYLFRTYYDPTLVALIGATVPVVLCSIVYIYRNQIYSFFEWLALSHTQKEDEE